MTDTAPQRKGIVLAGGTGNRLYPITQSVVKQLLPVYDKPLIYYPLSALLLAGIRDILIITTARDRDAFEHLLGDGSRLGVSVRFMVQPKPEGIAQAFVLGRDFLAGAPSCLVLGDNIFHGAGLERMLGAASVADGATVFAYRVKDPQRYGVVALNRDGRVTSIEEKPKAPKSNYALAGLYFFDAGVCDIAAALEPSARGELEIADVCQAYLATGRLKCEVMGPGYAWLDAGTPDSLLEAANFVQAIEHRQGQRIACLEEIALQKGFIDVQTVARAAERMAGSDYGAYLRQIVGDLG